MTADGEAGGQLNLNLNIEADLLNEDVQVKAPESSSPFNPLNLMLSLGASELLSQEGETELDSEEPLEDNSTEALDESSDANETTSE